MIRGTNCDCKILKTEVIGSKAYVTCLLFAAKRTPENKQLRFAILDEGESVAKTLSSTTYWIDRVSSISDSKNVSVNMHKEVRLTIDITADGTSNLSNGRWSRKFNLCLIDIVGGQNDICWMSDDITVMTDKFDVPEIKSCFIYPKEEGLSYRAVAQFKIEYPSSANKNFSKSNFEIYAENKSITTLKQLNKPIKLEDVKDNTPITLDWIFKDTVPQLIDIVLRDLKGNEVARASKIFVPEKKYSTAYIKTMRGIKKISAYYVKDVKFEGQQDEDIYKIKSNFDNACMKVFNKNNLIEQPAIVIVSRSNEEWLTDFVFHTNMTINGYDWCNFEVKIYSVNGDEKTLIKSSNFVAEDVVAFTINNKSLYDNDVLVECSITYNVSKLEVGPVEFSKTVKAGESYITVCSEHTYCSEKLAAVDYGGGS